ncbi:hypothetical protein [Actinomadura nitritigenes]|uniref:hypothetical protein n=1 Tax=Actinomadura nitritigenes TaxID=134602 RepID=UPI003D917300
MEFVADLPADPQTRYRVGVQQSALLIAVIGDSSEALPPVGHHQHKQRTDAGDGPENELEDVQQSGQRQGPGVLQVREAQHRQHSRPVTV